MFAEDLTAFLSTQEFAQTATLPGGVQVQVIFDNAYADVLGMAASGPTVLGRSQDLGALPQGAALQVDGRSWLVADKQPDGTGMTRLQLELAP